MVTEGRDKKGGFAETNSSEYCISKSKMEGNNFKPGFASHRINLQNKIQDHLNNLFTNKIGEGGKLYTWSRCRKDMSDRCYQKASL